jgi:hypothetical protein
VLHLRGEVSRIRRLVEGDENLPWKVRLVPGYGLAGSPGEEVRMCAAGEGSNEATGTDDCTGSCKGSGSAGKITLSWFLPAELMPLRDEAFSRFMAGRAAGCPGSEALADGVLPGVPGDELTLLFLEALLDHFLDTWLTLTEKVRHHRVLARDGFRCQVPGCSSRRNLHVHHVVFRSRGGTDDDENLSTLCAAHHLKGVHEGHITITGQAPDRLTIKLGVKRGKEPFAVWHCGEREARSR